MYKNSNFNGLSKKDIKRIQEIVDNIHAASMKQDLKNEKYVEGYIAGQRALLPFLDEILENVSYGSKANDLLEDLIDMIKEL